MLSRSLALTRQMHRGYPISQIELWQLPGLVARFDLVGYSLGAAVATFIAAEYSEMVRSLVLVSGFSYGGDPRMRLQFDLWLHLARTDRIALAKLLLVSGLSREFLSAFDENTIDGIVQSFVAMSDWPLIEQNIRVDLAVDVREQTKKIKAPTLSIAGKYDQIVPTFYTQELADLGRNIYSLAPIMSRSKACQL
jgi:3-oxoadipate enol-lactonase